MTSPSPDNSLTTQVDISVESNPQRRFRQVLSDAFAFVRGVEANKAIASITLDQLIEDQIARNGESVASNNSRYDPYTYDPNQQTPASEERSEPVNYAGGSDTGAPTKLEKLSALKEAVNAVVDDLTQGDPLEIADFEEYSDAPPEGSLE